MIGLWQALAAAGTVAALGAVAVELPSDRPVGTAHAGVGAGAAAVAVGAAAGVAQDTLGKAIFAGKGLCFACHGANAKGTPLAPDLTDGTWLNADGSLASIVKVVKEGVSAPKQFPTPMPPMGGAQLTDAEIDAVAQYIVSLNPPKS